MPDPEPSLAYETRAAASVDADPALGTFTGHASIFWAVDDHVSAFAPKAFRRSLAAKSGRIPVLFFHDPTALVGPALTLREDKTGLYHESKAIEDGSTGSFVLAHLRGGTPMGMSFGFATRKDRAGADDDPFDFSTGPADIRAADVRVITDVDLIEISVLPWVFASQPRAGIDAIRAIPLLSIRSLIPPLAAAIDGGDLAAEDADAIADLVSRWQRSQAAPDDPLTTRQGTASDRRRRDLDVSLALAESHLRRSYAP